MIPTAIGLPNGTKRTPIYDAVQRFLQDQGFCAYYPQLLTGDGLNISEEYNPATGGLKFNGDTLALLSGFALPPIFVYIEYYYRDLDPTDRSPNPKALNWPDPDNPTGKRLTQDELTEAQLTGYLRTSCDYLRNHGVRTPMMVFDEPPQRADDGKDGSEYGWTPTCEARIIKFGTCAQAAGWYVSVAVPGPTTLEFWRGKGKFPTEDGAPRLTPDMWILNDGAVPSKWPADLVAGAKAGTGPKLGLYNAANFMGLAKRMRTLGATAMYLHFQAEPPKHRLPSLVWVTGDSYTATADFYTLKAELLSLDKPVEPAPTTWQEGYAMLDSRLKAGGL